ncbi:MAG: site-specific integrase [Oscillibacter sp.]|nr:site-specific integrase [Oscillibacter sp.]
MGRKRKSGEGTVRLRTDGRWEGRVVIGYDDKGLPKTKNVLAKTKGECVEKLTALKDSIVPSVSVKVRSDTSFGEWLESWYEKYCKPQLRPSSYKSYEGSIRLYLLPQLGHIPLNKLTTSDLQQFFNWMKKDGRSEYRESRGKGLSDSLIRGCHSLCRRALEQAVTEGLIVQNPAEGCKLPPVRRKEMQILSREELQKLLIQAKEEGYYEVFLLELATGLRVGELTALQWDDLNFKTGELRIERQVYRSNGELLIQPPKTKASIRTVILPPPVVEALRIYKQTVSSRWIFPSPKKEDAPLAPAAASHRLAKILNHAGCKKVRFHDLRHVFATNALEHGMDIKTLSTIIGHVSSATTLNVYAHVTDDMQRQAAAKIDQGIGKVEPPAENPQTTATCTMTDFKPQRGKNRYWGSGYLGQTKGGRWNGRYTVTWPDGTKRTRDIYAATKDECERMLAIMITEMKREVAAEKERLRVGEKAS